MLTSLSFGLTRTAAVAGCFSLVGCSIAQPWPDSPMYKTPSDDPNCVAPATKEEAMAAMAGHYAHCSFVAYDGETPNGPLATCVVSYGFTDLVIENGELVVYDKLYHAENIANQPFETVFSDAATQAIKPWAAVCDVYEENRIWRVHRPPTPALVRIDGDANAPLSTDRNDPRLNDTDNDGKPGITVHLKLYGFVEGEMCLARREVFAYDMTLYSDGSLRGAVTDDSEQLVIGASLAILDTSNKPPQRRDPGLNPIILVPVPADLDTCEEVMANRVHCFPLRPHSKDREWGRSE